jgi:AcrR family transcriptional regulator
MARSPTHAARLARNTLMTVEEKDFQREGITVMHPYVPRLKTKLRMEKLRRVGATLFAEGGLAGISLQDVARAAKISPAIIHYYFGKRERMLHEILWHHTENMLRAANDVTKAQEKNGDPEAWLAALALALLELVTGKARVEQKVLLHTLNTLAVDDNESILYRLGLLRFAATEPMLAAAPALAGREAALTALGQAFISMVGDAALWWPEKPDMELAGYARMVARMLMEAVRTMREAN